MGKHRNQDLKRIENQLFSAQETQSPVEKSFRIYNTDKTDLDLESYSEAVRMPPKKRWLKKLVILLVLVALAVAGIWLWQNGGVLQWK